MGAIRRGLHPATGLVACFVVTAVLVALMAPFRADIGLTNAALILLLASLLIAATWGWRVGLVAALTSNLAYNFFFLDPLHTLTVQEPRNVLALGVFLAVSAVGGALLGAARSSESEARRRQAEAETVLALSRSLALEVEPGAALKTLCRELAQAIQSPGVSVLSREGAAWSVAASSDSEQGRRLPDPDERAMAERAVSNRATTGLGDGLVERRRRRLVVPGGRRGSRPQERRVAFVPLTLGEVARGVLRVDGPLGETPLGANLGALLSAVAGEAAVTVQRMELAHAASQAVALSRADEMRRALMASISHDLMTPLAAIKAAVSSLLDQQIRWSNEDAAAFHATIDAQADRLNRLISEILALNRIESGELVPDSSPIPAAELLDDVAVASAYAVRGRELIVSSAPALVLVGDRVLITQAIVNLVENAAKYSTAGGEIRVSARPRGEDKAEVLVEDVGPGIAETEIPHVFDRFYRAGNAQGIRGSGLGLTIVKSFVELCRGSVAVESSGPGTRFVLTLPAQPAVVVTTS